jgi:hypothetical protein
MQVHVYNAWHITTKQNSFFSADDGGISAIQAYGNSQVNASFGKNFINL